MRQTPPKSQIDQDISRGKLAVRQAFQTRARLRRASNPGGEREFEIAAAFRECKLAARPIRRYIGMLPSHPELAVYDARLRELSQELTTERRRLRAMKR